MTKRYEVTHSPHYIGGRLVNPGQGADSIVTLPEGVNPGRWLVEVDGPVIVAGSGHVGPFKVQHIPVGNFGVFDANGLQVGETFVKSEKGVAKAAADAAAAALNGAMEGGGSSTEQSLGGATGNLPDA